MLVQNVEDAHRQFLILEAEYGHQPQDDGNRRSDMETQATTSLPAEPAEPVEHVAVIRFNRRSWILSRPLSKTQSLLGTLHPLTSLNWLGPVPTSWTG